MTGTGKTLLAALLLCGTSAGWAVSGEPSGAEAPAGGTRAKADLAGVIRHEDYPAAALRAKEEGTVDFRLTISESGEVAVCEIVTSSGSATLDATTCEIMRTRPQFTPATDGEGRPTTDTVRAKIVWRIQEEQPFETPAVRAVAKATLAEMITDGDYPADALAAGEEGTVGFGLLIDQAGDVADCVILQSSGSASLDAATCRILRERAKFTPARDAAGKAAFDTAVSRIVWRIAAPEPEAEPAA